MLIKSLPLDQLDKGELYKIWIQPIVSLTPQVNKPDQSVR